MSFRGGGLNRQGWLQLTPLGSGCSIQIGKGLTDALAGSLRNIYLVVTDLEARSRLLERGVKVRAIRVPIDAWDGGFAAPGQLLSLVG